MHRVPLSSFARGFGLKIEALPENGARLTGRGRVLEVKAGSREVRMDGIRVFLAWPVDTTPGRRGPETLTFSLIDADRVLGPIYSSEVEPGVRRPTFIVLDPGHGGRDGGGTNREAGLIEKELTLDLANRLKAILEANGHRVVLTREDDTFVALPERPALANSLGADLFVSLHFNVAPNQPTVRGIETYVLTPRFAPSTSDPDSDVFAAGDGRRRAEHAGNLMDRANAVLGLAMHRRLLSDLSIPDRGLKRARFAVLRDAAVPAVLVEGAYVTNPQDIELIKDPEWMQRLAHAIAAGIGDYSRRLREGGIAAR